MTEAVKAVEAGMSLRQAAKVYNVPVETTRRRVLGKVAVDCKPGPATVFSKGEENELVDYVVQMANMGFGLTRGDLQLTAYRLAERLGKSHPFLNGIAGRGWLEGFLARYPKLVLRSTQPLSYSRAVSANPDAISDHFAKLGSLYARLNILSKPMQIYNVDECGVSVVHKGGKVLSEIGRKNVWAITSGEKGKNHTIVSCVSASGLSLPPFIIYPRKRITENLKADAYPGTSFNCSDSGWITQELYMEWFHFFLRLIPPTRPVLLIQDGHSSHVSIDIIKLARENSIHIICLPSHTTHLQPLDVGVFKSFKSHYNDQCRKYMTAHPGRTITTDNIASLVGAAWSRSMTPVNIMAGFRKAGAFPLNPGVITDRQTAPSLAARPSTKGKSPPLSTGSLDSGSSSSSKPVSSIASFTPEEDQLYRTRYEEGYDLPDSRYAEWLTINHLKEARSSCSLVTHLSNDSSTTSALSEVLVLPKPISPKRKRKPGFNTGKSVPIMNDSFLETLMSEEEEKAAKEEEKKAKALEKERKRKEREENKKEKATRVTKPKQNRKGANTSEQSQKKGRDNTAKDTARSGGSPFSSDNESDAQCPVCGIFFRSDISGTLWVCCDQCESWLDFKCSGLKNPRRVPNTYYCPSCCLNKN